MILAIPGWLHAANGMPDKIQDGNILHCFNWPINTVKAELPNIAAAGFGTVQLSPLQRPDIKVNYAWHDLYRPYDLAFKESAGMGSRADLESLCSEAAKYGIKVIVDVVANHVDKTSGYHDSWWDQNNHVRSSGPANINYGDRYSITHDRLGDYCEINSEHSDVIARGKAYVEDLKSMGVAGCRWDAAKHIATPSENCGFWSAVTSVPGMWHYGEILNDDGTPWQEYQKYMYITDNRYSNSAAQNNGGIPQGYQGSWTSSKVVWWGESHDTYANDEWSQNVDQSIIDRAYAAYACRNEAVALYLSRPTVKGFNNIKVGKGTDAYKAAHIAAVNKFRNAMVGKADYFTGTGNACSITRKDGGAVIVMKGSGNISIANGGGFCPAGTYKDMVSGGTFTVTSSTISGNVGASGIAVIMKDGVGPDPIPGPDPDPDPTPGSVTIKGDYNIAYSGDKTNIYYWGATSPIEWDAAPAMATAQGSDGKTYKVFKLPAGMTKVIFKTPGQTGDLDYTSTYVMNDNGATTTKVVFEGGDIPGPDPDPSGDHYVYYDGTFSAPKVWAWNSAGSCVTATAWPGDNMTQKDGKWYWEVPAGKSLPTQIIISDGNNNKIGGGDLDYVDKATYHQDGTNTPGGDPTPTKPVVTASPASGRFTETITVTLSVSPAATIYYTTDGSNPTTSSSTYSSALTFSETTTLKAFGVTSEGTQGAVASFTYTKSSGPGPQPQPGNNLITDYYKVNPDSKFGTNKTISMSFTGQKSNTALNNWTDAELIAQGVARDVCQAFKGVHERPIVDSYALYAAYDKDNLYLGVQYVYAVWDIGGEGKQPGESKPYNMDGKLCIAFDLDPNTSAKGITNENTSIWQDAVYTTFENGADAWWYGSTKPGVGTPGFFVPNAAGICDYTDPNSCKVSEVKYGYADGLLPSITAVYGQDDFSYDPSLLEGNTGFVDLRSEIDDDAHTFYEFTFPLSMMGITEDYIKNNGIGVMVVDLYGSSAHASLPYDPSFYDNVFESYSKDPSSSKEKEDQDVVTYSMARVGAGASLATNVVKSDRDITANFRLGAGCIEFYGLNGETVSVSSVDGRNMYNSRNASDVTVELPQGIYIVNIDGVGKAVRVL